MDYYHTLNIKATATQAEIKRAYRQLAKLFHPDSNNGNNECDRIIAINAAYEILGDPVKRQQYDAQRQPKQQQLTKVVANYRSSAYQDDLQLEQWLKQVYQPVNRHLTTIIKPFKSEINKLAADPFDDQLIEHFQVYLINSRSSINKAEKIFRSLPNPRNLAGVAQGLYYCINQLNDALEELEMYINSYDYDYLNTGQEMFKIAINLQKEAKNNLKNFS